MTTPVVTVTPDTTVHDAAALLTEHGFTALPVTDDNDQLIGIVTEADLVRDRFPTDPRTLIHNTTPHPPTTHTTTVAQVMTTPVTTTSPSTDIADLTTTMLTTHRHTIPIVTGTGTTIIGIISRRDLVRVIARDDTTIARDVRHRLETFGGNRWHVTSHAGNVTITDTQHRTDDNHIATTIAQAVPGVLHATITTDEPR